MKYVIEILNLVDYQVILVKVNFEMRLRTLIFKYKSFLKNNKDQRGTPCGSDCVNLFDPDINLSQK